MWSINFYCSRLTSSELHKAQMHTKCFRTADTLRLMVKLHSLLTLALKVSGEIHALAALPLAPSEWEAGLAPEPVWMFWRRKDLLSLPEIKRYSSVVQPVTQSLYYDRFMCTFQVNTAYMLFIKEYLTLFKHNFFGERIKSFCVSMIIQVFHCFKLTNTCFNFPW